MLIYIADDETNLAHAPLGNLAKDGQVMAYKHEGFWPCMDTLRDKEHLEAMWKTGDTPWKIWR